MDLQKGSAGAVGIIAVLAVSIATYKNSERVMDQLTSFSGEQGAEWVGADGVTHRFALRPSFPIVTTSDWVRFMETEFNPAFEAEKRLYPPAKEPR